MKIALFSDIHLEHRDAHEWREIIARLRETSEGADVVINAGDTNHDDRVRAIVRDAFEERGQQYVEVLGNHDYYTCEWKSGDFQTTQCGDLKIVHGTMWTNFDGHPDAALEASRWINDFRYIVGADALKMVREFNDFGDYVELMKPDVVVSHFGPSRQSTVPKWHNNPLNPYFTPNQLPTLIHRPKLWLHGHIHDPVDYVFENEDGDTRVVANPMGYPRETYRYIEDYACKILEV